MNTTTLTTILGKHAQLVTRGHSCEWSPIFAKIVSSRTGKLARHVLWLAGVVEEVHAFVVNFGVGDEFTDLRRTVDLAVDCTSAARQGNPHNGLLDFMIDASTEIRDSLIFRSGQTSPEPVGYGPGVWLVATVGDEQYQIAALWRLEIDNTLLSSQDVAITLHSLALIESR